MIGARSAVALIPLLDNAIHSVFVPFVLWMVLSLAVHAFVQQKVVAHLCCITAWVAGVLTAQIAVAPIADTTSSWRWLLWGGLGVLVTWLAWERGEPGSRAMRYENARRRAEFL